MLKKYHIRKERKFKAQIALEVRVRYFILSYLRKMELRGEQPTSDDIVLHIMPLLKNGDTPQHQTILSVLETVAEKDSPWAVENQTGQSKCAQPLIDWVIFSDLDFNSATRWLLATVHNKPNNTVIAAGLFLAVFIWGAGNAATKFLVQSWPPNFIGGHTVPGGGADPAGLVAVDKLVWRDPSGAAGPEPAFVVARRVEPGRLCCHVQLRLEADQPVPCGALPRGRAGLGLANGRLAPKKLEVGPALRRRGARILRSSRFALAIASQWGGSLTGELLGSPAVRSGRISAANAESWAATSRARK